jgi:hypothetical protein
LLFINFWLNFLVMRIDVSMCNTKV